MSGADETGHGSGKARRRLGRLGFHCFVWSLVFVVLLPLIWPVMMSLNRVPFDTLVDRGLLWWVQGASFDVFLLRLVFTPLHSLLVNSVIVSTASALLTTALAVTAAYGLDRFDFFGRGSISGFFLALPMVPQAVFVIPLFLLLRDYGLFDTYTGLVIAYIAFVLPFTTWLLRPFVSQIPTWIDEAALVDGCTRLGAFLRVFLPAAKPALAGAFVFSWMLAYNELLFAVILIDDQAKYTLPVALRSGAFDPGMVSVLASVPMLVMFALLWRFFLTGDVRRFSN